MNRIILACTMTLCGSHLMAQTTPPELGRIAFHRDYAQAVAKAKADTKPLFVLFDEVPG